VVLVCEAPGVKLTDTLSSTPGRPADQFSVLLVTSAISDAVGAPDVTRAT
jgi:hypothetical protein